MRESPDKKDRRWYERSRREIRKDIACVHCGFLIGDHGNGRVVCQRPETPRDARGDIDEFPPILRRREFPEVRT